ncbi:hypothetical protein SynMITS9220_00794 [Synechococcus sp. MIT S9220]|nr:hypothetical protein SynMITS9220_00794 [Synechococcus sp. MIT S9220]
MADTCSDGKPRWHDLSQQTRSHEAVLPLIAINQGVDRQSTPSLERVTIDQPGHI